MSKAPYLETLLLQGIYLSDDINEENPTDIFVDKENIMYAVQRNGKVRAFKLTHNQDEIALRFRDEILEYCLDIVTKDDEVRLADIFMYGKHMTEIEYNN
jgi:hypothetical protein